MKCCDLTSGKLRHKIILQRETKTEDNTGGFASVWADYKTLYGLIEPVTSSLSAGEQLHAKQLESRISHRIYMRYFTDIKTDDRLSYNDREMQIRAIINVDERNKWLELHAQEGVVN